MRVTRWLLAAHLLVVPGCIGIGDAPDDPGNGSGSGSDGPLPMQPTTPTVDSVASGTFKPIAPYTNIAGQALLVRQLDGNTMVSVAVTGVGQNVLYTAHVHAAPCQFAGGGHYKIDPAVADVLETNELWVKGKSSPTGALAA